MDPFRIKKEKKRERKMRVDTTLVREEKIRETIITSLESAGYLTEPINFWQLNIEEELKRTYSETIVAAELTLITKWFQDESVPKFGRIMRAVNPIILVYLKTIQDQKKSNVLDELFEKFSGRMKILSLWKRSVRGNIKDIRKHVLEAAKILDPTTLLEVRYSKIDKSLWLQFGDGFSRTIKWEDLPFSRRFPRLLPESAEIVDDGETISFLDNENNVFDVDTEGLRVILSPKHRARIEEEDIASRRELGERLSAWRKKKKLSQVQISEKSGIGQAAISRIERGNHHPRLDTIQKYASALGLGLPTLLEGPK